MLILEDDEVMIIVNFCFNVFFILNVVVVYLEFVSLQKLIEILEEFFVLINLVDMDDLLLEFKMRCFFQCCV